MCVCVCICHHPTRVNETEIETRNSQANDTICTIDCPLATQLRIDFSLSLAVRSVAFVDEPREASNK